MIELSNIGILEIRDDCFVATTTFTVDSSVPGTFCIEVAGKTIPEAVDKIVDYIREHSDEDEAILLEVKSIIFRLMEESAGIIRIRDHPADAEADDLEAAIGDRAFIEELEEWISSKVMDEEDPEYYDHSPTEHDTFLEVQEMFNELKAKHLCKSSEDDN